MRLCRRFANAGDGPANARTSCTPDKAYVALARRRFISGLMAQRVPFIVAELGADADPFMLHQCPAKFGPSFAPLRNLVRKRRAKSVVRRGLARFPL